MIDERDAIEKIDDPSGKEATPSSDSQYKVGPGRPPLESQFKKGAPSPNPKGRPRKNASIAPDLKKLLEDGLKKKVKAKNGDNHVLLSRATLGIEQLLNQFAKGDRYARRDLMDIAKELGVDLLAGQKEKIEEALAPSHQAILDSFISRHPQVRAAAPPPRVIAPPELLDGIVPQVFSPEKVTRPLNRPPPK
ncbi:MAG TPA: DUF5681 domain-containing protein [Nitrospira sp.]|jgi:hypothetical protein|nr:DUF5681 domain-containing protein [Nitrospira sp.]